ncbi:hypothetical protein H0G86_007961 [Trichoderma simmonsii]|uniref:Uncharacterized protein n=1 Tax=Trichoderma simmonsii TaxID=1491479 RepID=A0A8G0LEJ6_9HYPO|nr:hypothetical protein H0G86_007961 [Trichoderma simmonsii]
MSFLFLSETPLSHPPRLGLAAHSPPIRRFTIKPPTLASESSHPQKSRASDNPLVGNIYQPPLSAHHDHHAVTPQMPAYTNTLNFQRKRRDGQTRARSSSSG